jgi:predicted RecB family nuclease
VPAKITREILEDYLYCKTKAHLRVAGQQGDKSDYEMLLASKREHVQRQAIGKILVAHPEEWVARDISLTADKLRIGSPYVLDAALDDDLVSLRFDGLKRVDGPSKLGDFHYVPILFHEGRKLGKEQRLLLELFGLLLSQVQGRLPAIGVIWHGPECRATKVRLNSDVRKTERLLREVKDMVGAESPPRLALNTHCQVCEFHERCHDQAVQNDDITLLRGIGEKEIRKLNRKGIFTIAQLSCIFRLRKKGKRVKRQQQPHYFALQAAAIRDKKIYVLKPPPLLESPVRIYLDIEGDSDRSFAYLLGLIVDEDGTETRHSLWADSKGDEQTIFRRLLAIVSRYEDFTLIHYGSYETTFLKRMRKALGQSRTATKLLSRSFNLLSIIHSHIYFPVHSNSLKVIGGYLGFTWTDHDASGLKSIVMRSRWEKERDESLKQELVRYNMEDCLALRRVAELVRMIGGEVAKDSGVPEINCGGCVVERAEEVNHTPGCNREFRRSTFALPDLEFVNRCAYFDYQRDKIFLRTNDAIRAVSKRKERARKLRINKVIEVRSRKCPRCNSTAIVRHDGNVHTKTSYNLVVTGSGIRRQVILCKALLHYCKDCCRYFLPPRYKRAAKHFHSLMSWAMYQHVVHRISFENLAGMFEECFGIKISVVEMHMFKTILSKYYRSTYQQILSKILSGQILHSDETHVNFRKGKGYVWVLANMENVVYVYRPTRNGDWLQEVLHNFQGVLISDFYSAYDSIPCKQQKCLVHLIRDMNDDLLRSAFDEDFKWLVSQFGSLLRIIISTIDRFGLRRRHLRKHEVDVAGFYRSLNERSLSSELAEDYRHRLVKYRDKLFTFLRHDGVPWNNNNSEHAIKPFARYRAISDGQMSEPRLRDYLVLLTLYQTCKYRGISFLRFLLSQEKDLDRFRDTGRPGSPRTSLEIYPKGLSNTAQQSRSRRMKEVMDKRFFPHG